MRRILLAFVVLIYGCGLVSAQSSWTTIELQPANGGFNGPSPTGPARDTDAVLVNRTVVGSLASTSSIPLSAFATAESVSRLATAESVARLATQVQRDYDRLAQGIALAGAINVLPPNPGDRFAVTFGGAAYGDQAAGSIAFSFRLAPEVLAYGAIAQGRSQTLVKGGMSLSFR